MRVESHGFLAWETRHKAPRGRRQRVKSVRLEAKPPIGRPPARRAHERPTSPTYVPTLKQHRLSSGMSVRCDNNNTTTKHPDSFVSSASPHKHSSIVPPVVLKPTSPQDITGGAAYVLYDSGTLSADPPSVAPEERRRKIASDVKCQRHGLWCQSTEESSLAVAVSSPNPGLSLQITLAAAAPRHPGH